MEFLEFKHVTKTYASVRAVDDVSFAVVKGELVTLLGPSGSGKTSLLSIVAGFVAPDSGEVLLDGRSLLSHRPNKRNLGVVFQQYALFPHMNIMDNVAYPLLARGVAAPERRRRVGEILELVHLGDFQDRRIQELSGGQQQRVALARALVFQPPMLLMDEPLSALDRQLRLEMQLEIRRIQKSLNITTLYVTHDQEEAMTISDRIVLMRRGKLVQIASPHEIFEQPTDAFAATFIGGANILNGRITHRDDDSLHISLSGAAQCSVEARPGHGVGDPVQLALRPERIVFAEADDPFSVAAAVEERLYLGTQVRVALRVGEQRLTAVLHSDHAVAQCAPGAIVRLDLRKSRPILLK